MRRIVLHQEHWHPGVVGIVASRMVEKYYKPSIMMATVDGVAKGSARSVSGFDIYEALKRCEDKIIQFGGHKYAAGLTVELDRLDEFREAFNHAVREMMTEELQHAGDPDRRGNQPHRRHAAVRADPPGIRAVRPGQHAPDVPGQQSRSRRLAADRREEPPAVQGPAERRRSSTPSGSAWGISSRACPTGRRDLECVFTVEENDWNPTPAVRPGDPVPQLKIKDLR